MTLQQVLSPDVWKYRGSEGLEGVEARALMYESIFPKIAYREPKTLSPPAGTGLDTMDGLSQGDRVTPGEPSHGSSLSLHEPRKLPAASRPADLLPIRLLATRGFDPRSHQCMDSPFMRTLMQHGARLHGSKQCMQAHVDTLAAPTTTSSPR